MNLYISEFVIDEFSRGNPELSLARRSAIHPFQRLESVELVGDIAKIYLKKLSIPKKSELDAYHLAIAVAHEIEFLVSWNYKHIANPFMIKQIQRINDGLGLSTPLICVPREFMEG